MQKAKAWVLALAAAMAWCAAAWAAWPFGNIGLGVDEPLGQLDVGGTTVLRGPVFFWNPEVPEEAIRQFLTNEYPCQTFVFPYMYNFASTNEMAIVRTFGLVGEQLVSSFPLCLSSMSSKAPLVCVGKPYYISSKITTGPVVQTSTNRIGNNCLAMNMTGAPTNTFSLADTHETTIVCSSGDAWSGGTVRFDVPISGDFGNCGRVRIFTRQGGVEGTVSFQFGTSQSIVPRQSWFSVTATNDFRAEFFFTNGAAEADGYSRLALLEVADCQTGEALTPVFADSLGWTLTFNPSEWAQ